jgi:hypothetical protein
MIERKNKYIRIRVIGGSGIFDSIVNILKKPIVSKLLAAAGKSVASALGEKLVTRMIAPAVAPQPQQIDNAVRPDKLVHPAAPEITQQPSRTSGSASSRAQELISRYSTGQAASSGATKGTGVTMRRQAVPTGGEFMSSAATGERSDRAITIQEYVKSYKGAGIKLI